MGLRALLGWEFRNFVRFPLLELLVFIVAYLGMLSAAGGGSYGMTAESLWGDFPPLIAQQVMFHSLSDVVDVYVPLVLVVTIFASVGIGREVEAGFVKVALSYPVRRRDLFLVKFGGCFLTSLAIFAAVLFSAVFLRNWTATLYILSSPVTVLTLFGVLVYQTFYAASVATAVAFFSRSTTPSFIGSIGILYVPVYMAQIVRLDLPFVPPKSTQLVNFYLRSSNVFWRQYDALTFVEMSVVPMAIACVLLLASYLYFTRRYDLS